MTAVEHDTIVASATPWGRSALAVLRLSGPGAKQIAQRLCPGPAPWLPRRASLRRALDAHGCLLDEVVVTWMPGPRSYTGEDSVELSCHGNPVIVEAILASCVAAGARPARPGEFTRQAFVNGRVDLPQAEAVAALIDARSPLAVDLAQQASQMLSQTFAELVDLILDLAAELELRLDHPGDELGELDDDQLVDRLHSQAQHVAGLAATWQAGRVRLEGARVALVGPVNAGKSTLFNRLLSQQRALVSAQPGTTRDVIERSVLVDGLEITWMDTAGERMSTDPIEQAGIALGRRLVADADLLVVVVAGDQAVTKVETELLKRTASRPRLVVATHGDRPQYVGRTVDHVVSGTTGAGVDVLRTDVRRRVALGAGPSAGQAVVVSQRQHELLRSTSQRLQQAAGALSGLGGPAIAAEECARALAHLGELSGRDSREDVLDRVFSRFCIGK